MAKSKFENVIGDLEAFRIMLDGAFKNWEGSYDVLTADTNEYLFAAIQQPGFRPFCHALRSGSAEAERRCHACDEDFARRIASDPENSDRTYYCHVGLVDSAVPIVINNEHLATIFFGQARPVDPRLDQKHFDHVKQIEKQLEFEPGSLEKLARDTPQVSKDEFEKTRSRVAHMAHHISHMGYDRLALQQAVMRDKQRKNATDVLQKIAINLADLSVELKVFWRRVDEVLEEVGETIGARCAMILVLNPVEKKNFVRALSGLPPKHFKDRSYDFLYDTIFQEIIQDGHPIIRPLDQFSNPETISGSIQQFAPLLAKDLKEGILTRIGLGDSEYGTLIFCFSDIGEYPEHLPREEIMAITAQLATLIGTAYHNRSLYHARAREIKNRQVWLEKVTHQLIAPLNSLRGHAENAYRRVSRWERQVPHIETVLPDKEILRWKFSFEDIMWNAHYAARLARNLAWVVYDDGQKGQNATFDPVKDIGGMLIRSARSFQGMARERGLRKVEVDTTTLITLNGFLWVYEDLFRQAFENLLDNAVKYGHPGTEVIIQGEKDRIWGRIQVTNEGICLRSEDVEKIFDYEYRTEEAQKYNAPGTGIGLFVARQIIHMHGGKLTAKPSVAIEGNRYRTTFVIELPLKVDERK